MEVRKRSNIRARSDTSQGSNKVNASSLRPPFFNDFAFLRFWFYETFIWVLGHAAAAVLHAGSQGPNKGEPPPRARPLCPPHIFSISLCSNCVIIFPHFLPRRQKRRLMLNPTNNLSTTRKIWLTQPAVATKESEWHSCLQKLSHSIFLC